MRQSFYELGQFAASLYRHWVSLVAGIIGIILGYVQAGGVTLPYWLAGALGLLLAGFFAWRDMFREARPYDAATLEFARRHWAEQTPRSKVNLRDLLVQKQLLADSSVDLARCQFVTRSNHGMYSIIPEYLHVLDRVAHENQTAQETGSPSA